MSLPVPSAVVGIKLASLAVHVQSLVDPEVGHPFDRVAAQSILQDPEVKAYLDLLRPMGLLPLAR